MRKLKVAAVQMRMNTEPEENIGHAEALVREAAADGARLVLLPELFAYPYFCKDKDRSLLSLAAPAKNHPALARFADLARALGVVLPISFFERAGENCFNSLAALDADGATRGIYRKAHIPEGPGYEEKFYFTPGDTPFEPVATAAGKIGALVCWDQWFPEPARLLALHGAELLLYPSAIGSEPQAPELDSSGHWRRVMQGHAAANVMPVVAANRVGEERGRDASVTFYGSSFIADHTGAIVAEADRESETIIAAEFDLDAVARARREWGVFRDRRPELYRDLAVIDAGN
ncbi:MAG: N-carbamoylputrescine amidase [Gammaproteobacteria bacterium]|nr:N-carbamoylputrescine amidase [Gammaproteobacteria bacterium]